MRQVPRRLRDLVRAGALATVVGSLASVLLFLRPWHRCPETDDAPLGAGCPVTGPEAWANGAALLLLLLGAGALLLGLLLSARVPDPEG